MTDPLLATYNSSPAFPNQTAISSKLRKAFQNVELQVLLNKAVHPLKGTPDDCEETFSNTTIFSRFHVHLFKLISPQLNDQTDSDSIMNTLLLLVLHQNHSLNAHEEEFTHAEKVTNEVINVFNQFEFDTSSGIEVLPNHFFSP